MMQTHEIGANSRDSRHPARRPWNVPAIEHLPRLEKITLQSPIWGGEGGFSFLDVTDPMRRRG